MIWRCIISVVIFFGIIRLCSFFLMKSRKCKHFSIFTSVWGLMGIFRGEIILQKCFSSCLFLQSLSCLPILCTIFWPGICNILHQPLSGERNHLKNKNRILLILDIFTKDRRFLKKPQNMF